MKSANQLAARGPLALLLAIPVALALLVWLMAREVRSSDELVEHTVLVELSLEEMMSDLRQAQGGLRRFGLTGENRYLDFSHAAAVRSRRDLAALNDIVHSPQQRATLARMRPLVETRLSAIDRVQGRAGASESDSSEQLTASIQSLATQMHTEADRLLGLRQKAASANARRLLWSVALGCGVMLVVVASLYRRTRRYIRQRMEAEERLSRLNAELDQRVSDRTAALQAREELFETFIRHVPAAVAMFDREMRYLQLTDRWCTDYGVDPATAIGRSHYEFFPSLPERWKEFHRRCLAGETIQRREDQWTRADGSEQWLHWEIVPWGSRDGLPEGILIFAEDITVRKQSEEMLRESEATNRALLETAGQAIVAADESGAIVLANPMTSTMFGYTADELLGKGLEILMPERLRARHNVHFAGFTATPVTRPMGIGFEISGRRTDGSEFPVEISLSSVHTAKGVLAVAFISDITARRRTEDTLRQSEAQLRALAGSLITAQEDERRRVARELHDDVTQRLAFLSIELGSLSRQVPEDSGGICGRLRALRDQAAEASEEVRRVSHGLHPSVIEHFGLAIALEEVCNEFQKSHPVHVVFDGLIPDLHLDRASATNLFRIAQECLRNAVMHGHATEVHVRLTITPAIPKAPSHATGLVQLRVTDDGVGFDAESARGQRGLGLISMRERCRLLGGTLTISSHPGQGTETIASVPVRVKEVDNEILTHSSG